jgi:hypothetical protein
MKVHFRYVRQGETYEVSTNLMTIVTWERKMKRKATDGHGLGWDDMCFLAYEASKQAKIVVPAVYDDFINQLDELDVIDTESARPTEGTPSEDD